MLYGLEPYEGFGVKKTVRRTVFSRKRESGTEMQSIWVDERGSMRGKPSRRRALLFPPKNIDTLLSVYVFLCFTGSNLMKVSALRKQSGGLFLVESGSPVPKCKAFGWTSGVVCEASRADGEPCCFHQKT